MMDNYNNSWTDDRELKYEREHSRYFDPRYIKDEQKCLLEERNIILAVIFSIITIGIYFIYWMNKVANTIKIMDGDFSGAAAETVLFFLVPFYNIYWVYTRGRKIAEVANRKWHYHRIQDESLPYLLVSVFLGNLVVIAIMQNDINRFAGDLNSIQRGN